MTVQYATVAEFQAFPTGVDASGLTSGTPSELDKLLQGASEWFDIACGHGPGAFIATGSATYTFDGTGKRAIFIPYAVSISQVSVDGAVVPSTNWIAYPEESWLPFDRIVLYSPAGSSQFNPLQAYSTPAFSKGTRNVAVTAVWGYMAAPSELVKEAVILKAADQVRSRSVRTMTGSGQNANQPGDWSQGRSGAKRALEIASMFRRVTPL